MFSPVPQGHLNSKSSEIVVKKKNKERKKDRKEKKIKCKKIY